jgi:hypothetical protein
MGRSKWALRGAPLNLIAYLHGIHATHDRDRLDDYLRLGQGIFVGERQMDKDLVARRRQGGEPRRHSPAFVSDTQEFGRRSPYAQLKDTPEPLPDINLFP